MIMFLLIVIIILLLAMQPPARGGGGSIYNPMPDHIRKLGRPKHPPPCSPPPKRYN